MKGRLWTYDEREILTRAWTNGTAPSEIARLVGHTTAAVRCKAIDLGLPQQVNIPWSVRDCDRLRDMWALGIQTRKIARELGRSVMAVQKQANLLKIPRPSRKRWTPGEKQFIHRAVDNLIDSLAKTFNVTPNAVRGQISRYAIIHNAERLERLTEERKQRFFGGKSA